MISISHPSSKGSGITVEGLGRKDVRGKGAECLQRDCFVDTVGQFRVNSQQLCDSTNKPRVGQNPSMQRGAQHKVPLLPEEIGRLVAPGKGRVSFPHRCGLWWVSHTPV